MILLNIYISTLIMFMATYTALYFLPYNDNSVYFHISLKKYEHLDLVWERKWDHYLSDPAFFHLT